jgi:CheY-like chemotaxis protein
MTRTVHVLVVDDCDMNLLATTILLKKFAMEVFAVNSGEEAIDEISNGMTFYNAIFMDYIMPGMDGVEATRQIRSIDNEYAQNIPIIAYTSIADKGNEQMFFDNGFNAVLSKPATAENIRSIVQNWLR